MLEACYALTYTCFIRNNNGGIMHTLTLSTLQLITMMDALRTLKFHYIDLIESKKFAAADDVDNIIANLKIVESELERLDVLYIG